MVRSLLERAKPQLVAALEKQKLEYPNIAGEVEKYLKETYFVSDLRYGTTMDLKSLWMQATKNLVDSPWEYFEED
jgi:hypothetical protein